MVTNPRWDPDAYTDDEYHEALRAFVLAELRGLSAVRAAAQAVEVDPAELVHFQVTLNPAQLREGRHTPGVLAPLVGLVSGRMWLFDGYHRAAVAWRRSEPLSAAVVDLTADPPTDAGSALV